MGSRSFSQRGAAILESLYQHRLLSTPQIHALHAPDARVRWAQELVAELSRAGLVESVGTRTRPPTKLHFLTPAGLDAVEAAPRLERRRVQVTPEGAAGSLQAHTLAVNDVGVAFVEAARRRGDECGPLAWRHEVAHAVGAGSGRGAKGGDLVIADAVLRYTLFAGDRVDLLSRFVELDRATMPLEDLAGKLRRYARLHGYVAEGAAAPGWRRLYPHAFPQVLVVFAGRERRALERRMQTVLAVVAHDGEVRAAEGLVISGVLLEDLVAGGPFRSVFVRHDNPGVYVDWLGHG